MAGKAEDVRKDRRSFLKLAGLGSVAGSAALVAGSQTAHAVVADKKSESGYRETEQVKTFYRSARF